MKIINKCKGITKTGKSCQITVRKSDYCRYHCNQNNNNVNNNINNDINNDIEEECVICFEKKRSIIKTQCGHEFCRECICNFQNNKCPLCRFDITDDIKKNKNEEKKKIVEEKRDDLSDMIRLLIEAGISIEEIQMNYVVNF